MFYLKTGDLQKFLLKSKSISSIFMDSIEVKNQQKIKDENRSKYH